MIVFSPSTCELIQFLFLIDQNWQKARCLYSTSLHILDPTGFNIELKKSIVSDDALLPR